MYPKTQEESSYDFFMPKLEYFALTELLCKAHASFLANTEFECNPRIHETQSWLYPLEMILICLNQIHPGL